MVDLTVAMHSIQGHICIFHNNSPVLAKMLAVLIVFASVAVVPVEEAVAARTKGKLEATQDPAKRNYQEGMERLQNKDVDGALDSFLQAVYFARNNYYPEAYHGLGLCYKARGEDAKAIEAFTKCMQQSVYDIPDTHVALGDIYRKQGRLSEAARLYYLATAEYKGADRAIAFNALGLLREAEKRMLDANSAFIDATRFSPTWGEAWMNLADNALHRGDWSDCIRTYARILNDTTIKGLDLDRVYQNKGLAHYLRGDHQGAIDCWHAAIDNNPYNYLAHYFLGQLFEKEKHLSSALKEYKQFVRFAGEEREREQKKEREALIAKAKMSITKLEQMLAPQDVPQAVNPAPYRRPGAPERTAPPKPPEDPLDGVAF